MALNFNVGPYFDDFDPSKNFHRILFKPGAAVQARELTQSQTILQNQISNFASAIYTQNTPISGGQVTINQGCYYIKLNTTFNGAAVTALNFLNQIIQDASGTISARVIKTVETTTAGDPPTLIVTYLSGQKFTDGLQIQTSTGATYYASVATSTAISPSTGLSSVASISSGIFYVVNGYSISNTTQIPYSIGNFVQVDPQTIVLDKYDNTPTYRIGLQINETIYDYVSDPSLLDPAIGASNYQAPGADRYVVTLTLVTLPLATGNDSNFIELIRINNGVIIKQVSSTSYSQLDDYFAKRDYETNGDYVVEDFKLTPSANTVSNTVYDLSVGKGIAYVHGYRIENQSALKLTNNRAQTTANISNNPVFIDYGNYYVVDTANGVFDIGTMPQVDLHCVPAASINTAGQIGYTSTLVGTAFMRNFSYVSGTGSITKNYIYNAYISDITSNTLTSNVTGTSTPSSFTAYDPTGAFSTANNAYLNVPILINSGGVYDTKTVVGYNGATKTFTVDSNTQVTASSTTTFTLLFKNTNVNSIVQKNATYGLTANVNINSALGKYNGLPNNVTLLNAAGTPELIFQIGYPYVAQLNSTSYSTQRVYRSKTFSSNTLQLTSTSSYGSSSPLRFTGSGTLSGSAALQSFIIIDTATGNVLDFSGGAGSGNTISISTDKITATISSNTYNNKTVTIIAQVSATSGDSSSFVLKSKYLITGNTNIAGSLVSIAGTSAYQDLAKGQILIARTGISATSKVSLYVNDVKKISKIYDTTSKVNPTAGTSLTRYKDITNYFSFDDGQRDSYYDHASISLISGAPLPIGNIIVVFDYYRHTQDASGDGYFSIQSYNTAGSTYGGVTTSPELYPQIPTYTAKDGIFYRLSDCIDFRPCRVNGQTAYVWEYSTTQTSTNDIGILLPTNLTNFLGTYKYYLARKDKLVLTKDRNFIIVQGNPAVSPILPVEPSGSLVIANLLHDAYTSYVGGEAPAGTIPNLSVNKVLNKRWAKQDITTLESRISNLEYYTSLSILEQNANALQVPDSVGLNRFKNGILVDNFSTYATADTNNLDFYANINTTKNQLSAAQIVNNFQLQNPIVVNSLGTVANTNTYRINSINAAHTNIFTLPYTVEIAALQPYASNTISVNPFSVVVQQGTLQMNPPMDNWVDNNISPAVLNTDPTQQINQQSFGLNYLNAGSYQEIPGRIATIPGSSSSTTISTGQTPTTYNQTTTGTYSSTLNNTVTSSYSPVSSFLGNVNGYLTNISILPYIRPQRIIIRAKGLLVNSNVSTFFDGVDVSQYMSQPNTIELTNVTGTFEEDDVVGYYLSGSNTFYPIARVISALIYASGTKVRIYCAEVLGVPNLVGSVQLQNGKFDTTGAYIVGSQTATGTVNASAIVSLNQQGIISGVGGGYSNTLNANVTTQIYGTPVISGYSDFLNTYGVWGDAVNSGNYTATFPVFLNAGNTYTISVGCSGSATIYANGVSIGTTAVNNPSQVSTFTYTAPGGLTNIGWVATSSGTTSAFAMKIINPSNYETFTSTTPSVYTTNSGTQIYMPGGGSWSQGATQVKLDPSIASNVSAASSSVGFYVGSTINFISQFNYSIPVSATYTPPTITRTSGTSGGGGSVSVTGGHSSRGFVASDDGCDNISGVCSAPVGPILPQFNIDDADIGNQYDTRNFDGTSQFTSIDHMENTTPTGNSIT